MPSTRSKMTEEDQTQFNVALRLRQSGERKKALRMLLPLQVNNPDSAALHGMIGTTFFELKQYALAAASFRRATELSEKSRLASLGLFHSLWQLDQQAEAIIELKRFTATGDWHDYVDIAANLGIRVPEKSRR